MSKFLSRKFITTVSTMATLIAATVSGSVPPAVGAGGVLSIAMTYVIVEGHIDARRAAAIAREASGVASVAAVALAKAADTLDAAAAAPTT